MSNNSMVISGILGHVESRQANSGNILLSLSLPVKGKQGGEDVTNWMRVTVFGKQAEYLSNRLQKGMFVSVHGRLEANNFNDQRSFQMVAAPFGVSFDSRGTSSDLGKSGSGSAKHSQPKDDFGYVSEESLGDIPF